MQFFFVHRLEMSEVRNSSSKTFLRPNALSLWEKEGSRRPFGLCMVRFGKLPIAATLLSLYALMSR